MSPINRENHLEIKSAVIGFSSLLSSGLISAVGFILIASNRWNLFDSSVTVFIILFIQWQTLGLTICKLGVEQVVFAFVSERPDINLNLTRYIMRIILPMASVFSFIVFLIFSAWAAAVTFLTIVLDSSSLIIAADLNARKMFKITAVANLLNYPIFFLFLFLGNLFVKIDETATLTVFLFTSLIRGLWLFQYRSRQKGFEGIDINCKFEMGFQQALNYLMFRADQIVLAVVGINSHASEVVTMYVFLAKFPELISGVMVIAGTVANPKFFVKYPVEYRPILDSFKIYPSWIIGYIILNLLIYMTYIMVWKGIIIPLNLAIPFLIHSLCIFPSNNFSYSMLRQGYLVGLNTKLALSILTGFCIAIYFCIHRDLVLLSWIVPVQLCTFITLVIFTGWGKHKALYA